MVLIGLGSNLESDCIGTPREICVAALVAIEATGVRVVRRSRWFRSAPVPPSDQPWFVNGVAVVEPGIGPSALLERLHAVEAGFGRVRRERNEARVLDLDLLAYDDLVLDGPEGPVVPHPRLHERAFVLLPLAEVAPGWRHPRSGALLAELIAALPPGQHAEAIAED
jgi:2-amino-4-hydroxy-6-hydroxymethyldihydropteridine diphosphokinase